MAKPTVLDLFCGAGGAAAGYAEAGFDVLGVDIEPQPRYPFEFVQADALDFDVEGYDLVHASPPCQAYSHSTKAGGRDVSDYPDLIPQVRKQIEKCPAYVIENVPGAPLRMPVLLCGTMFPGLRVIRHRWFETNFIPSWDRPQHRSDHPLVHTTDKRKKHYGKTDPYKDFLTVAGGGNAPVEAASDAMGIHWMTWRELVEAVPPAYTEWIGRKFLDTIEVDEQLRSRVQIPSLQRTAVRAAREGIGQPLQRRVPTSVARRRFRENPCEFDDGVRRTHSL